MALQNQEIGARLRELRGQKPQTTVADELGVAERTYQNWEAGDAKPSYRNLQRLADYFGVGEEFILAGEGSAPAPRPTVTPDLSRPASAESALAEVLAAITAQLVAQTQVLNEVRTALVDVKGVLVEVKGLLGKDTETADRMESLTGTLGGAAAQLDAHLSELVARVPQSEPQRKTAAKRKTAPKSSPRP